MPTTLSHEATGATAPTAPTAPTRIVLGAGVESRQTMTGRAAAATAGALGVPLVEFPSHHGGFLGGEHGYAGEPEAFAVVLREVLTAG